MLENTNQLNDNFLHNVNQYDVEPLDQKKHLQNKKHHQNKKQSEDILRKKLEKKQDNINIRNYKSTIRTHLLTSRFNTETRKQNEIYRKNKWANGCLYCSPEQISQNIPIDSKIIVLEMDNDKNSIFGVGLLTNKPFFNKYAVYGDENYNRYNYIGKYRIEREDLTEQEEAVFKALDILCFKGNQHMKRGHGLKAFPTKLLMNCSKTFEITPFIENMFKTRYSK